MTHAGAEGLVLYKGELLSRILAYFFLTHRFCPTHSPPPLLIRLLSEYMAFQYTKAVTISTQEDHHDVGMDREIRVDLQCNSVCSKFVYKLVVFFFFFQRLESPPKRAWSQIDTTTCEGKQLLILQDNYQSKVSQSP